MVHELNELTPDEWAALRQELITKATASFKAGNEVIFDVSRIKMPTSLLLACLCHIASVGKACQKDVFLRGCNEVWRDVIDATQVDRILRVEKKP